MKCPACENELTEHKVSGIQANVCNGSCGGLWFHHAQIKKIERLKPGAGSSLLHFEVADGVKTYRGSEHPCPHCKTTLLYRHFFSRKFDTEVNQCSKCSGFWVDVGGLSKIIQSQQEKKEKDLEKYFIAIINEKISGMNLASQDMAQAAEMITSIFVFLIPDFQ
ncbi:MAG: Zn-finger nucleic acid-binding protein [Nitrospinales bacterium]|jgi:Zn-finger nucleic acid-binding protein